MASVTTLTGKGKGTRARAALAKLVSIVYPFFEKQQAAFLKIK